MEPTEIIELTETTRIVVSADTDPSNPFNEYVEEVAAIIATSAYHGYNTTEYNGGIEVPTLTRDQVKQHFKQLLGFTEYSNYLSLCRDLCYLPSEHNIVDVINKAINESISGAYTGEKFEQLAALYTLLDQPCISVSDSGYSQGDYHFALLKFVDGTDLSNYLDPLKYLRSVAQEYRNYAYGDVWTADYQTLTPGCDHCEDGTEWETVDSCGGYSAEYCTKEFDDMLEDMKQQFA